MVYTGLFNYLIVSFKVKIENFWLIFADELSIEIAHVIVVIFN